MTRDKYYDALAHHGVKGQKWGIRRYQKYTDKSERIKRIHSKERYQGEALTLQI